MTSFFKQRLFKERLQEDERLAEQQKITLQIDLSDVNTSESEMEEDDDDMLV